MYCIVECRKGVSINNIKPITEYPIYYIISKKEIDRAIEEYLKIFLNYLLKLDGIMLKKNLLKVR